MQILHFFGKKESGSNIHFFSADDLFGEHFSIFPSVWHNRKWVDLEESIFFLVSYGGEHFGDQHYYHGSTITTQPQPYHHHYYTSIFWVATKHKKTFYENIIHKNTLRKCAKTNGV